MLRHRACFHQALITHHPDCKTDVGELHQYQSRPEMVGHLIIADNSCADNRQQRATGIAPAQAPSAHHIVNQRDIQRRQDGKQQKFRNRQVKIGLKTQHIHNAQLHRAHQHIQADGFQALSTGAQEGQKYQRRQTNPRQHRKIAINVASQVFAIQAKGESPQDSGDNQ